MFKQYFTIFIHIFFLFFFQNCTKENTPEIVPDLKLESLSSGTTSFDITQGATNEDITFDGTFVHNLIKLSIQQLWMKVFLYWIGKMILSFLSSKHLIITK